jgi:hypothetical protein
MATFCAACLLLMVLALLWRMVRSGLLLALAALCLILAKVLSFIGLLFLPPGLSAHTNG